MLVKEIALRMLDRNSPERKMSERMMGKTFDKMTQDERALAATCLAAFDGEWQKLMEV